MVFVKPNNIWINPQPIVIPDVIINPTIPTIVKQTTIIKETTPWKAKKAGINGSHVFLIVDESGSMSGLKKDTIGGINHFIKEQAKDKIATKITIVKFESDHVRIPVDGIPANEVGNFTDYHPAGGTNLLDAVGVVMEKINNLLSQKSKNERPSIFVQIITDGEENSSQNYNRDQIKKMINSAEKQDWIISYVGANVDSFAQSASLGLSSYGVSNYSVNNTMGTYSAMASSVKRTKSMRSMNMGYSDIQAATASMYNEDETKAMNKKA